MTTAAVRILISLAVVTFAFFLNMSAYMCLEGLQSTINPGAGTYSLSVAYATVVITSLFLPTMAMDFLKHSRAIGVATLGYAVYSAANCYPTPPILICASVILGCSGGVIWAAGRVYVSNLALTYANLKGADKDKTTSHFFGIFLAFVSSSLLVLNGVSSLVLQASLTHKGEHEQPCDQEPCGNSTLLNATTRSVTDYSYCGVHNCDQVVVEEKNSTNVTQTAEEYDKSAMYVLFGVFAGTQVLAALLVFFALTDIPQVQQHEDQNKDVQPEEIPLETQDGADNSEIADVKIQQSDPTTSERIRKQAISTAQFIIFNHAGKAMIPMTMHCGVLQAFAFGQFTRYWIACYLGVEYIGFAISAYGIGSIMGSYGGGFLTKFMPRWIIVVATLAVEITLIIILLAWDPNEFTNARIFFLLFGITGLVYSVQKTVTASVYSLFFGTVKESANASLSIWDMFGTAIAYAFSSAICNRTYMISMLSLSIVGTALYLLAERNYSTNNEREK